MNQDDLKLRLLAGLPIDVEGIGLLYPLTIKEIIEFGESRYNDLLSCLLVNNSQKILGLDLPRDISNFDIFTLYSYGNQQFRQLIIEGLILLFRNECTYKDGFYYFTDLQVFLTEDIFDNLQNILRLVNKLPLDVEPDYNPANERARNFIEKMQKSKKKKPKTVSEMNLHSIISGVAWKSFNTNLEAILKLTIYQLYDAFDRLEHIDNYSFTLSALHAGTIDGKKVDLRKLNWAKTLQN